MKFTRRSLIGCMASAVAGAASPAFAAEAPKSTERQMRRIDRNLTQEQAIEAINRTDHAVLSTADASGTPYGVAITPVYYKGAIYFHCAKQGRKTDNMLQNPRVSIMWVAKDDTDPTAWAVDYVSVIVSGKASRVTGDKAREEAMMAICKRHAKGVTNQASIEKFAKGGFGIDLWKVEIEKISGKSRNPYKYFAKQ